MTLPYLSSSPLSTPALSFAGAQQSPRDIFPTDEHLLDRLYSNKAALAKRIETVKSPAFEAARNQVYKDAKQGILNQLAQGKQGVVILDIDDTTIDCLGYMEDPRYMQQGVNRFVNWVNEVRNAPAIDGAKDLIQWMEQLSHPNFKGYAFLTGRHEGVLQPTLDDLDRLGLRGSKCVATILKPVLPQSQRIATADFKIQKREELITEYGGILANLGDQLGDMAGDQSIDYLIPGAFKQKLSETIR